MSTSILKKGVTCRTVVPRTDEEDPILSRPPRFDAMLVLVSMVAMLLFAGGHTRAYGEEYRVNTEEDFSHWKPGAGACETAPGDERCTLRAAIMEANARPGKDRIVVPSGTYFLSTAAIVIAPASESASPVSRERISKRT